MTIYILLLIYILLCTCLYKRGRKSKQAKKIYLFCTFFAMAMILSLRGADVGEDTRHYLNMFDSAQRIKWSTIFQSKNFRTVFFRDEWGYTQTVENGWLILCKLVGLIINNGQVFLAIVSFVTCSLFAKFIYDQSIDITFSTYVFLCESMFMVSFNASRQILAVGMTLQAFTDIKDKKYKTALLWILFAFFIHNTSIIALLLFPILLVKNENEYKRFKIFILFTVFFPFFIFASERIVGIFLPAYQSYFSNNYWTNSARGMFFLWIYEAILIALFYRKKFFINNSFQYCCLILIYFAFEFAGTRISILARVGYFFRAYLILFFPCANYVIGKRNTKYIQLITSALLLFLYLSYARLPSRYYLPFWSN